jgi:hypothetical protein
MIHEEAYVMDEGCVPNQRPMPTPEYIESSRKQQRTGQNIAGVLDKSGQ